MKPIIDLILQTAKVVSRAAEKTMAEELARARTMKAQRAKEKEQAAKNQPKGPSIAQASQISLV